MTHPDRSARGAALAATAAGLVLGGPFVLLIYLAAMALAGCVIGPCQNPQSDVLFAGVCAGLAVILLADTVLWGVAGHRRMTWPWVCAATGLLLVPFVLLVIGRGLGAF
ncbi:hypothetical protein K8F61_03030 [Microbacterium resistens]|uniref:DUF2834 domain-containing protein n=1 Tax=Microbacterium resistens TaxID=156977 RepID=A0ABY3RWE4_9MICO|nr:hypothetical protein [Microbacterium resistens]UGS27199.1 hypothetical protein K8F61_03030 [Microbacterium resistens]